MKKDPLRVLSRDCAAFALIVYICCSSAGNATAAILPVGPEKQVWSDMAFPTGVIGGFDSGLITLSASAGPSNDVELGAEFGPSLSGKHYGTGGTKGSAWNGTLTVSGVEVQPNGTVTNGGTVQVVLNGSAPDSIADDYGISFGSTLLTGTVVEVLLDATGDDTLDILYSISGGALQGANIAHPEVPAFAPFNLGLLRIAGGGALPADFSSTFSFSGGTINNFGIPEPSSVFLGLVGSVLALFGRATRRG